MNDKEIIKRALEEFKAERERDQVERTKRMLYARHGLWSKIKRLIPTITWRKEDEL